MGGSRDGLFSRKSKVWRGVLLPLFTPEEITRVSGVVKSIKSILNPFWWGRGYVPRDPPTPGNRSVYRSGRRSPTVGPVSEIGLLNVGVPVFFYPVYLV